jgi:hypothetical protein
LSYQWKKGAANVGTNSNTLTINGVAVADAGNYSVEITGDCGNATSNSVALTVNASGVCGTNLTMTPTVVGEKAVKFTVSSDAAVSAYEIRWKPQSSGTWQTTTSAAFIANSYRLTNLVGVTTYDLGIRSKCVSDGSWSNWSSQTFTTVATPICALFTASVGLVGASVAQITWPTYTANTFGYEVRWRVKGSMPWTTYSSPYFASATSYRISGLTPSTNYEWQIRNVCNPGGDWNVWSSIAEFTTAATATCSSFTATTDIVGATVARVVWPTYTANTYGYEVRWRVKTTTPWTTYSSPYFTNVTNFRISGLTASTTYEWQIRNVCSPGEWNAWNAIAEFTTQASPMCLPLTATGRAISSTAGRVSWPVMPNNTYSYELRWKVQGAPSWTTYASPYFILDTARTISGLTASTTYEWEIRTLCAPSEWNAWSSTSTFTTLGAGRVGISEALSINVYPNPSSGLVNISGAEKATYVVLNTLGQMVASGELTSETTTLDLSNQGTGMYLLKVVSNGAVQTKQLVVSK